jgi:hypothetical protein
MAHTAMTDVGGQNTNKLRRKNDPTWWNDQHSRSWDRVKEAFSRDWSQTKADFSKRRGRELDQSAVDTVKQAVGTAPIPPRDEPNDKPTGHSYEEAEPALRFGYGASAYYFDHDVWDASLEAKMRDDWSEISSDRDWKSVREHVRRGWDHARGSH